MAGFAHTAHPTQQYLMVRAELAQQSFEHIEFTTELLVRFLSRIGDSARALFQRWAAAHRQAVQDRLFWELALTDHRMMAELHAIKDYEESAS